MTAGTTSLFIDSLLYCIGPRSGIRSNCGRSELLEMIVSPFSQHHGARFQPTVPLRPLHRTSLVGCATASASRQRLLRECNCRNCRAPGSVSIHMKFAVLLFLAASPTFAEDATAIMVQVAANVEKAVDARRQYVYQQTVRASLARTNGQFARREKRQYVVIPSATGSEKELVSFQGEYRKGKQSVTYQEPVKDNQDAGIDAELLQDLTEELINAKDARDGIEHNLFPLRSAYLPAYAFTMKDELQHQGRRTYRIAFEPAKKAKEDCVHAGKDEDNGCVNTPWMGEAWIDAAEFEPVRIDTHLAFKVPWAVRTFLGTNLKQTGFAITYQRVAGGVWFPATYGTEFQVAVLIQTHHCDEPGKQRFPENGCDVEDRVRSQGNSHAISSGYLRNRLTVPLSDGFRLLRARCNPVERSNHNAARGPLRRHFTIFWLRLPICARSR
jgi:hypothetical protein